MPRSTPTVLLTGHRTVRKLFSSCQPLAAAFVSDRNVSLIWCHPAVLWWPTCALAGCVLTHPQSKVVRDGVLHTAHGRAIVARQPFRLGVLLQSCMAAPAARIMPTMATLRYLRVTLQRGAQPAAAASAVGGEERARLRQWQQRRFRQLQPCPGVPVEQPQRRGAHHAAAAPAERCTVVLNVVCDAWLSTRKDSS